MDFDSYLERMKEKGLKEVAESQEELGGDETAWSQKTIQSPNQ